MAQGTAPHKEDGGINATNAKLANLGPGPTQLSAPKAFRPLEPIGRSPEQAPDQAPAGPRGNDSGKGHRRSRSDGARRIAREPQHVLQKPKQKQLPPPAEQIQGSLGPSGPPLPKLSGVAAAACDESDSSGDRPPAEKDALGPLQSQARLRSISPATRGRLCDITSVAEPLGPSTSMPDLLKIPGPSATGGALSPVSARRALSPDKKTPSPLGERPVKVAYTSATLKPIVRYSGTQPPPAATAVQTEPDGARTSSAKKAAKGTLLELTSYHAKKSVVSSVRPAAVAKEALPQTTRKISSGGGYAGLRVAAVPLAQPQADPVTAVAPTPKHVPALKRPPALPKLEKLEPGPAPPNR